MMIELEAMMGSDLVTMVSMYGSAAFLIASMAAVLWLSEARQPRMVLRAQTAKAHS